MTLESGTRCRTEQDDIRHFGFLRERHLAPDPPEGFGAREAGSFPQPRQLGFSIGRDDDDHIHALIDAGFKQQGDFIDDDRMGVLRCDILGEAVLQCGDSGVNEPFEPAKF